MKQFIYFESTEGGMQEHHVSEAADLHILNGWMARGTETSDFPLQLWMGKAEVGDYYEHRLGTMVRVKDSA